MPEIASKDVVARPDLIDLDRLIEALPQAADVDYWRSLTSDLDLSEDPFASFRNGESADGDADDFADRMAVEGYFQTGAMVLEEDLHEMKRAVEAVRAAGFPPAFAMVYDVFYRQIGAYDHILRRILGENYRFLPNAWIYYVAPSDEHSGSPAHRDTEYPDTIQANGLPTVLNAWIAITEASPLNGCMYILPKDRDPEYEQILQFSREGDRRYKDNTPPQEMSLQDIRALTAPAGSVSMWDQYVYHWGGRASRRAGEPRISMATYFQRGDIPPLDPATLEISKTLPFEVRLGIILRATLGYTNAWYQRNDPDDPIVRFAAPYLQALKEH